jgi:5-epi-alpha-selinene synthase
MICLTAQCRENGVEFAKTVLGKADERSIDWLCTQHGLGRAEQIREIQPSKLAAYAFPRIANTATLQLCTDLITWLFLFDDEFADGDHRQDPKGLATIHRQFGGVLHAHTRPPGPVPRRASPWVTSLGELLGRFDAVAPRSWTARLRVSIADYFRGCEAECGVRAERRWPTSSEYLAFRDGSIGVYPMLDLIEFSSEVYFDAAIPVEGLSKGRCLGDWPLADTNQTHRPQK